jgi:hypothetical protein
MNTVKRLFPAFLLLLTGCMAGTVQNRPDNTKAEPSIVAKQQAGAPTSKIPEEPNAAPEFMKKLQRLPTPSPVPAAIKPAVKPQISVKGIYVSARKANGKSLEQLIKLLDDTELNAMVIDVKNESGQITYDSQVPMANEIRSDDTKPIPDIRGLLRRLKEKDIYAIARIVTFKDSYLSSVRNDLAMQTKAGKVWYDKKGVSWVDPYQPEVQAYNIDIAEEAARLGFDEIQFDYVRFPENGNKVNQEVRFRNPQNLSKAELISGFLQRAKASVPNVPISADVFGLTPSISDDMGIGQEWNRISPVIDTISPMVYPSHYSDGALGIATPDLQPYAVVKKTLQDAISKNEQLKRQQKSAAKVRPWLQDFTAKWGKIHQTYGPKQIREQIKAAKELGIDQYLLWNPRCTYSYQD